MVAVAAGRDISVVRTAMTVIRKKDPADMRQTMSASALGTRKQR